MNTMYRNEKEKNGYDQVKEVFKKGGASIISRNPSEDKGILSKDEFENQENKIIKELCKDIDKDKEVQDALDKAVEKITDLKWPEEKKMLETNPFDKMPKALLHVHNKVGLSVDQLFELFGTINGGAADDKEKIGFVVEKEEEKEEEGKVLFVMYKGQYVKRYGSATSNISFVEYQKGDTKYKNQLQIEKKPAKGQEWDEFNEIFKRMEPLFHISEFYEIYHKKLFEECGKNNIGYVELRVGFEELVPLAEWKQEMLTSLREGFRMEDYFYHRDMMLSATPNEPKAEFLQIISKVAQESGLKDNVKVILTANRNIPEGSDVEKIAKENICAKLDTAIAIKNGMAETGKDKTGTAIADMVIGFDLVNQEKDRKGLTDEYAPILYANFGKTGENNDCDYYGKFKVTDKCKFDKLRSKKRIELMRFFLHDGESSGKIENNGDKYDNAITGPICSRHRIGHGFKMGADDNVAERVMNNKDRKFGDLISDYILYGYTEDVKNIENYPVEMGGSKYIRRDAVPEPVIELCPISNYMLNYVDELKKHPAIKLMEKGILAVICNDDPQIFDNPGLSYDYAVMYAALKKHFTEKDSAKAGDKADETVKMPYKLLKLSAFLGFFYQEMSKYYYVESQGETTKGLWVVNNTMEAGDSSGEREGSEYQIFNTAVEKFNAAWKTYADNLAKEQTSPPTASEGEHQ